MALGILVHGDNHFIVRGPLPSPQSALALARRWSVIQIGSGIDMTREEPGFPWRVSTREFRENLEWAVIVEDARPHSAAVTQLLAELAARGVPAYRTGRDTWDGR
ncbi:MAG: hypothetical protein SFV54_21645 [Bryobacteraceae bacterium]|nr:hypothetical protein [Bryobacteraceae bacterium]